MVSARFTGCRQIVWRDGSCRGPEIRISKRQACAESLIRQASNAFKHSQGVVEPRGGSTKLKTLAVSDVDRRVSSDFDSMRNSRA